eukprot:TRINITY_DN4714_c0_g1_i1.p1 TRINITY_DN4714_c0_g1~~TRINITY_DN4714_c0_g1_i1.p1  ORF type:complete len:156 (-),score=37.56 TRINITY_DN4714_c0_g1_i1:30-458(-)
MALQLSSDIASAYQDVRSDKTDTRWLYLKYDDNKTLSLGGTGSGGLDELAANFSPTERAYGYLRVTSGDDLSARAKFVFIAWVGEKVSPLAKARVSTDKAFVKEVIKDFAIEVHATDEDDIQEEKIMAAVKKAGGANYGDGH